MLQFCGYNFCKDGNTLDPYPTSVENITTTEIKNAIYDDMYITRDITSPYSITIPTAWDFFTIMQANFNGNINAGNVDALLSQMTSVRIKRRIKGTFDWITLKDHTITEVSDISFAFEDNLNINDTKYEYAWVPVLNNVEGNYVIAEILSQFNGVFICDANTIYRFYAGVSYGASEQVQKIGVFEPFGRQYPVYVANAMTNYQTGSVSGRIIGNYETTQEFNRAEMVAEKNALLKYLTNKKAKIIKDWNGNAWLIICVGNPTVAYDNNWGMGMMDVGFNYSESGDINSKSDLQANGMIPIIGG